MSQKALYRRHCSMNNVFLIQFEIMNSHMADVNRHFFFHFRLLCAFCVHFVSITPAILLNRIKCMFCHLY